MVYTHTCATGWQTRGDDIMGLSQNLTLLWVIRVVPHKVLQVDAAEGKGGRGTQAKTISLSVKALEKVGEKGLLGRNKAIKGI